MADIIFRHVRKVFSDGDSFSLPEEGGPSLEVTEQGVVAVQDFCLEVADREFVVLVGPSGCGKSTTLRMVAGLEEITDGEILIGGKRVNELPPKKRDVSMVFQNYALFPHMTVYDNIGLPLRLRKRPKAEIDEKVRQAAETLGITEYLRRKPRQLSGGQRQRVAIGRSIVRHPQVFLMDEPLSNLDAALRTQMRTELLRLHSQLDATFLYVTHDQIEAMTLGDRVVIMRDGYIMQAATPQEVYQRPQNIFVAGFIGTPRMNMFPEAELVREGEGWVLILLGERFPLTREQRNALEGQNLTPRKVVAGVRPNDVQVGGEGIWAAVELSEQMGTETHVHLRAGEQEIIAVVPASDPVFSGSINREAVKFTFSPSRVHLFDPETEERII